MYVKVGMVDLRIDRGQLGWGGYSVLAVISLLFVLFLFFFSSRRRHTRYIGDWSSDVCSSDLLILHHDGDCCDCQHLHNVSCIVN